jgi:hypothetical protein
MNTRILASSILALGLLAPLSPSAFAAEPQCDSNRNRIADYGPCEPINNQDSDSYGATVVNPETGRVGDFIDETPEETNQRSND